MRIRRNLIVLIIVAMTLPLLPVAAQESPSEEDALGEAPVITTNIPGMPDEDLAEDLPDDSEKVTEEAETVTLYALIDDAGTASTVSDAALALEGVVAASSTIGGLEFTDLVEIEVMGTDNDLVAAELSRELGVTVAPGNTTMELAGDLDFDDLELMTDPRQKNQWALKNPETEGGIGVYGAWSRTRGKGAVVAVADSGLARGHPDMEKITWRNSDETPGNNRDDDGNGFVDDMYGWDFVQNDNRPQETIGHGTAVASLIAAPQNGKGISGVAPAAKIMPLRVCPDRSCSMQAVLDATIYAGQNGADVLNLSLGGEYPNNHPDVAVIRNVMRRVQEEHGITIVA
ncbi:MAG: S8 family serine peptidase, partial [Acidimicrobiia bacterium]|nr:S8 family serine peptidase [Acidimicrobiia bacterium]